MTVSNNEFTHVVPTLPAVEFEFAAVFSSFQGVDVTVEHNTIHSCARFACYKIGDGSGVGNPVDEATYPSQMGLGVFFGQERAAVEGVALNARGVRPFHFDRPDHHGPGNQVDR